MPTSTYTEKGEHYIDLPDAVHIYITQADFLKTKKGVNLVERKVVGTNILVSNGIQEYYVCLKNTGDTLAQTELFKYIQNCNGIKSSVYFPKLVKRVQMIKENKKGDNIMCEIMEKIELEAEARGEAKGETRGIILGMIKIMRDLQYLDVTIEKSLIEKYQLSKELVHEYMCTVK